MQLTTASGDLGLDASAMTQRMSKMSENEQVAQVSKQFETIFIRQILNESLKPAMKSMLGGGEDPGSDIYQSLIVDTLAESIEEGGGLGISNIIQLQLQGGEAGKNGNNADDDA